MLRVLVLALCFLLLPHGARAESLLARWSAAQADLAADAAQLARCRADGEACNREDLHLIAIAEAGRVQEGRARLGIVNRAVNLAIRPVSDERQSGVDDDWAAASRTMRTGAGDCEDYAIVKFLVLRELGFADADLRLAVVRDEMRQSDHAVVAARLGGEWLVLDNRGFTLVPLGETRYRVLALLAPAGEAGIAVASRAARRAL
jgi:predicted transglutaminase-like cysteine proteinase